MQKGVCPYKYVDEWKKFNETMLPAKEKFYSHLNMKDITDPDYAHAKRVCKDFEIKILGEHYDWYVQCDASSIADVFENFRNMSVNICELKPAKFLSAPELAWQEVFKKTKVKLNLLSDIDMLLMVEKLLLLLTLFNVKIKIMAIIQKIANQHRLKKYSRRNVSLYI